MLRHTTRADGVRRRLAAVGLAAAGALAVVAPAGPASADLRDQIKFDVRPACDTATGVETIVWTLSSAVPRTIRVRLFAVTPEVATIVPDSREYVTVIPGGSLVFTETIPPTGGSSADLLFIVEDGDQEYDVTSPRHDFGCAAAFQTTIRGTAKCDAGTGTTTVNWVVTSISARADNREALLQRFSPDGHGNTVQPRDIVTYGGNRGEGRFTSTIAPGKGKAGIVLRIQPRSDEPVDLASPKVEYECKAPPQPSSTVSPSNEPSDPPSGTASPSTTPGGSPGLPKTGAKVVTVAGVGGALFAGGLALIALLRRRRNRFVA